MNKRKLAMTGAAYQVVAAGIRDISDEKMRIAVADHFAKYFHGRSQSFDPQLWFERTGGLINRRAPA